MGKGKTQKAVKPTASSSKSTTSGQSQVPPAQLMDLVESFLSDQGFDNAHREFQKHRSKKGWKEHGTGKNKTKTKDKDHHSLVSVFQTWKTFASQGNTPAIVKDNPMEKITKVSSDDSSSESESESSSDDADDVAMADAPSSEESSSSESSESSSSEESDSDEEDAKPAKSGPQAARAGVNPLKRKAESDSESSSNSSSDADMSDPESEDDRRKTKKVKTKPSPDDSSSESSSSEDESSEEEESDDDDNDSSDSESESSESESDSEAQPQVDLKKAANVPLPDSSSESSSESDDEQPPRVSNGAVSDSSATLDKTSPEAVPSVANPPLPPDPRTLKNNNRGKNGANAPRTQNQPFSRIRKDVVVDPRLSSNAYVTHGYGEKAHQDLIVTKGKGFTKEKNKKKRGSYKGGPLDVHKSRSIKFED